MADRDYTNDNQVNVIRVVEYMAQEILLPKSQKELGEALGISKDQAFRTLWNLKERGWVEEVGGAYRLSPGLTIISDRLRLAVADTIRKYIPETI